MWCPYICNPFDLVCRCNRYFLIYYLIFNNSTNVNKWFSELRQTYVAYQSLSQSQHLNIARFTARLHHYVMVSIDILGPLMGGGSPCCRSILRNGNVVYPCHLFSSMSHVKFKKWACRLMSLSLLLSCHMALAYTKYILSVMTYAETNS